MIALRPDHPDIEACRNHVQRLTIELEATRAAMIQRGHQRALLLFVVAAQPSGSHRHIGIQTHIGEEMETHEETMARWAKQDARRAEEVIKDRRPLLVDLSISRARAKAAYNLWCEQNPDICPVAEMDVFINIHAWIKWKDRHTKTIFGQTNVDVLVHDAIRQSQEMGELASRLQ